MLTNHIDVIHASGFHVQVAPDNWSDDGAPEFNVGSLTGGLTIGKIVADGADIEFMPTVDRKRPFIFRMPKLIVHDLAEGKPLASKARCRFHILRRGRSDRRVLAVAGGTRWREQGVWLV